MIYFNYKITRQSQTLCEEGAESGGSLEKKMAELPKEVPEARLFYVRWSVGGRIGPEEGDGRCLCSTLISKRANPFCPVISIDCVSSI